MALGVIPPLCATLGPVLAGPEGCSRGRWRSGPSKWRHTAAPEGRGQGAPRTCRCIETSRTSRSVVIMVVREHHAPVGALRRGQNELLSRALGVREHHAPVGALRRPECHFGTEPQTPVREHHAPVGALRRHLLEDLGPLIVGQGAPRTCRCIETVVHDIDEETSLPVREHHAPVGASRRSDVSL